MHKYLQEGAGVQVYYKKVPAGRGWGQVDYTQVPAGRGWGQVHYTKTVSAFLEKPLSLEF